jgi:hypothetical protein
MASRACYYISLGLDSLERREGSLWDGWFQDLSIVAVCFHPSESFLVEAIVDIGGEFARVKAGSEGSGFHEIFL